MIARHKNIPLLILLLLIFVTGCDLEIQNPNHPDTGQVYAELDDVLDLIGESFNTVYQLLVNPDGIGPILSTISFQHSGSHSPYFGMGYYNRIPRIPIGNYPDDRYMEHFEYTWYRLYRANCNVTLGLRILDSGEIYIPPDQEKSARAFAKFVQGLVHGYLAVMYDRAFIFDETKDPGVVYDLVAAHGVFAAAALYLGETADLGAANPAIAVPGGWTGDAITNLGDLARLALSYRAYFRINMPRTPAEANTVDWTALISDIDNGLQRDFAPHASGTDSKWFAWNLVYFSYPMWSQLSYFIHGMADQSGNYKTWYDLPHEIKYPILPGEDLILMVTPDLRFPQGSTTTEQEENRGVYIRYVDREGLCRCFTNPWQKSLYRDDRYMQYYPDGGPSLIFSVDHLQLIKAEALYRTGDPAGAASIINNTRVGRGGLSPAEADGTNTECVPKLPSGKCGDLFEMLKWEKRLEAYHQGLGPWYFDSRRWGDHMEGTFLQLPIPGKELNVLKESIYTFGGVGGEWAAPQGNYGF
jgi:starch-binding outer membrane protein, SusD/RagB family